MDKLKQWVGLALVAVLVIAAGGWFLLISPKRSEAADLDTQAGAQLSGNAVLQTQLSMLKAQAKDLPRQQAKIAAVAAKIPENPALPSLVRALDKAALDADVELISIAPSVPVVDVPGAAPGTPAPAVKVGGAGTRLRIPLVINVSGGYFQIEQFFNSLEGLTRALKVTAFTLAPGVNPLHPPAVGSVSAGNGSTLLAAITSTVYMASGRTAVIPAAPSTGAK